MTNIVAMATIVVVVTTVETNWTKVGTFTALDGTQSKVEEGQLVTNEVRYVPAVTNASLGPIVGERRTITAYPMHADRNQKPTIPPPENPPVPR